MGNCYITNSKLEKRFKLSKNIKEKVRRTSFNPEKLKTIKIRTNADILKDYKVISQIGRGLFSKVFLVLDKKKKKKTLKIIKKKNFSAPKVLEKFLIEKEILQNTSHNNILKLYKTTQSNNKIYYELEFASKGNILQMLNKDKIFDIPQIKIITSQIILALLHLHRKKIFYGDLKAENILINKKGIIKLCDFNLSGTASLLCHSFQGTLSYISPEVIMKKGINKKADFWALGVLVFLIYFRHYPFNGVHNGANRTEIEFNIKNRIFNPCFTYGEDLVKGFILDLLDFDVNKRLGNDLEEFVNHPFFFNFDWERVKSRKAVFGFFEEELSIEKSGKSSFKDSVLNFDQESNARYFIDGFSYECDDEASFFD